MQQKPTLTTEPCDEADMLDDAADTAEFSLPPERALLRADRAELLALMLVAELPPSFDFETALDDAPPRLCAELPVLL